MRMWHIVAAYPWPSKVVCRAYQYKITVRIYALRTNLWAKKYPPEYEGIRNSLNYEIL